MRLLALLAVSLVSFSASAQQIKCPDAGGIARTECLEKNQRSANMELERLYVMRLANINSKENDHIPKAELGKWRAEAEKSQQAWLAYRDLECGMIRYEWWGGSGAGGAITECLLRRTAARIRELKPMQTPR